MFKAEDIQKLKELQFAPMTDEIRNSVENFWYSKYSKPAENFDSFGLKFSHNELDHIGLNVIFLPIEYMATYVDKICFNDVSNVELVKRRMSCPIDKNIFNQLNTTSIGNLAYLYMHCPSEEIKEKCKKDIQNIFDWYLESVKANLN